MNIAEGFNNWSPVALAKLRAGREKYLRGISFEDYVVHSSIVLNDYVDFIEWKPIARSKSSEVIFYFESVINFAATFSRPK